MEKENEFRKVSCLQKHGLLKVNKIQDENYEKRRK